jgi:hypothetical protein
MYVLNHNDKEMNAPKILEALLSGLLKNGKMHGSRILCKKWIALF